MSQITTFQVFPRIPNSLSFLTQLSNNLWWSWQQDAIELFRRIDPNLWDESDGNPLIFETRLSQNRLEQLAADESFLAHMERVRENFEQQVTEPVNRSDTPYRSHGNIAYFSMEFGVHESLPLFAGGLGVLAGDHLKAASGKALPLTGVGLLYQHGYFHQFLDQNGWQQEKYPQSNIYHLPITRAKDPNGQEVRINVTGPQGEIHAIVWQVNIGRIPLYLLDTHLLENPLPVREITSRLYIADKNIRLSQEILLGIGGMKALAAMGITPSVCHMNEGHCAFCVLERLAQIMETHHLDLPTAREIVARTMIFTTHTPVAAGQDEFPAELVKPALQPFATRLGTSVKEILSWGQPMGAGPDGPLSMFVLGLRMAQYCNGVSKLHGKVARNIWAHVWPGRPEKETPISHITNGVHVPSFMGPEIARLFERYLGPKWYLNTRTADNLDRIDHIYDEELWQSHEISRSRLVSICRKLVTRQYSRRNAPKNIIHQTETILDPNILTIAFARRFATYKRATLLLQDPDRLEAMINSDKYPVQFIFAGKSHPKDNEGKELIKQVVEFARRPNVRHKIAFIENYDMHIARYLVQGADVWLNNPRRPFEACGTSGMKAAVNGILNVSILDGWWAEGYCKECGWRIGNGEEYTDTAYQDVVESRALYNVLEDEVIPCFYEHGKGNMPARWLEMMKASMKLALKDFNSLRMVNEYEQRFYLPAIRQCEQLLENNARIAKELSDRHKRLITHWHAIQIQKPVAESDGPYLVDEKFQVTVQVFLGTLKPEEVDVELFYGRPKSLQTITHGNTATMAVEIKQDNGNFLYSGMLPCQAAGRFGFTVRITPKGDDWLKNTPGLITWAQTE
jgi:starch phosphorylase